MCKLAFRKRGEKGIAKAAGLGKVMPGFAAVVLLLVVGCSKQLVVHPPIPSTPPVSPSQARVGVYMKPTPLGSVTLKSGIWPKTAYDFSPRESLQEDLMLLTKRHFPNSGPASSTVDDSWDYVIEYSSVGAQVETHTLASRIPLTLVMRNPVTFKTLYSETVVGVGRKQPGRFLDIALGTITERRALEKSLNEAAENLLVRVDASLAKMAINESELKFTKPGEKHRSQHSNPMRRSRHNR